MGSATVFSAIVLTAVFVLPLVHSTSTAEGDGLIYCEVLVMGTVGSDCDMTRRGSTPFDFHHEGPGNVTVTVTWQPQSDATRSLYMFVHRDPCTALPCFAEVRGESPLVITMPSEPVGATTYSPGIGVSNDCEFIQGPIIWIVIPERCETPLKLAYEQEFHYSWTTD